VVHSGERRAKDQPLPPPSTDPAWKVCTPQTVPGFSAALYYFGQRLHKDLDVPMGLINSDPSLDDDLHRVLDVHEVMLDGDWPDIW
jgi:hypothetical protein